MAIDKAALARIQQAQALQSNIKPGEVVNRSVARILSLSGQEVYVDFPNDMTDDDLLLFIMEIAKSLRAANRIRFRPQVQVATPEQPS